MTGRETAKTLLQIWADWPDGIPEGLEQAGKAALWEGAKALMVLKILDYAPNRRTEKRQSVEKNPAKVGGDCNLLQPSRAAA